MKKAIVISGVNLSEGGPLTVIKAVLSFLNNSPYSKKYKVYALVHSKKLFEPMDSIEFLEFPNVKKSWLRRVKFEYIDCLKISKKLDCHLWLSLHDMTPNVISEKRAVYCHNASPFYKQKWKNLVQNPLRFIYTRFYKYLYAINIKKNSYVIVQQKWIKDNFKKLYGLLDKKIIVSLPTEETNTATATFEVKKDSIKSKNDVYTFFFPAFPREFKNFEIICKAVEILNTKTSEKFEVYLTLNGTENEYAKNIVNSYKNIENIKFIGLQPKSVIEEYYTNVGCLIFPSKLESWGLPISEFKKYEKPIIASDLPYAYETVGDYEKIKYFDPENSNELAKCMEDLLNGNICYTNRGKIEYEQPICHNWQELFDYIIQN